MAEMIIEGGRLFYPPEDPNNPDDRNVCHPETDSRQTYMDSMRTLEEALQGGISIQGDKPSYKSLWGNVTNVEMEETDTGSVEADQIEWNLVSEMGEETRLYPINRAQDVIVGEIEESDALQEPASRPTDLLRQVIADIKKNLSSIVHRADDNEDRVDDILETLNDTTNGLDTKAPIDHSTTDKTYGGATDTLYGHVILTDTYDTEIAEGGAAADSYAPSQKALVDAYNALDVAKAPEDHKSEDETYGSADLDHWGHVKLSDTYSSVTENVNGLAASQKGLADAYAELSASIDATNDEVDTKAVIMHASSEATYGMGTGLLFGHLKITDDYTSECETTGAALHGMSVSQYALYQAYDALCNEMDTRISTHEALKANTEQYGHVKITDEFNTSQGGAEDGVVASSKALTNVFQNLTTVINTVEKKTIVSAAENGESSLTTFNADGSITSVSDTTVKNTVFNADGSITETMEVYEDETKETLVSTITAITVFNADGSIRRTVTAEEPEEPDPGPEPTEPEITSWSSSITADKQAALSYVIGGETKNLTVSESDFADGSQTAITAFWDAVAASSEITLVEGASITKMEYGDTSTAVTVTITASDTTTTTQDIAITEGSNIQTAATALSTAITTKLKAVETPVTPDPPTEVTISTWSASIAVDKQTALTYTVGESSEAKTLTIGETDLAEGSQTAITTFWNAVTASSEITLAEGSSITKMEYGNTSTAITVTITASDSTTSTQEIAITDGGDIQTAATALGSAIVTKLKAVETPTTPPESTEVTISNWTASIASDKTTTLTYTVDGATESKTLSVVETDFAEGSQTAITDFWTAVAASSELTVAAGSTITKMEYANDSENVTATITAADSTETTGTVSLTTDTAVSEKATALSALFVEKMKAAETTTPGTGA